jgi:hypothetical protein
MKSILCSFANTLEVIQSQHKHRIYHLNSPLKNPTSSFKHLKI